MYKQQSVLSLSSVKEFYDSNVVIERFNESFSGRWHTQISLDIGEGIDSVRYLCSLINIQPFHHVLDFGSGVGVTTCDIAQMASCRIRGLNISKKQNDISNNYVQHARPVKGVEFDLYDGGDFPYNDRTFDRVVFFESACHVPDKTKLFSEIYRVLKPGGMCCGQDWMLTNSKIDQENYSRYIRPIEIACAVSLVSIQGYRDLLKKANFSMVRSIDARQIAARLQSSFSSFRHEEIRVDPKESFSTRLSKGNAALGNAFYKGLFTIGFILGEKK